MKIIHEKNNFARFCLMNCPISLLWSFEGHTMLSIISQTQRNKRRIHYILLANQTFFDKLSMSESMKTGGGERIRTADLPRAKRTLYQLSYAPFIFHPKTH